MTSRSWTSYVGTAATTASSVGSTAIATFHALNDAEARYIPGEMYSTVRHTRPWVYYQGTATIVPFTILGQSPLPSDRRISLQRRGWRTGLLGWTIGGWLGGTLGKEVDVTPQNNGSWDIDIDAKRRRQYNQEITDFLNSVAAPNDHKVLETDFVHIPASSGDGYFRFLVYPSAMSYTVIASTATFRVGSLSLSSAQPRGASIVTLVPELVVRSGSLALYAAAWSSFYAAFPILKIVQMIPGTSIWGNWAMNRAYRMVGLEEIDLKKKFKVEERQQRAEDSVVRNVPFGSVGVRTTYDLKEDAKQGKGGIRYDRSTNKV